MNFKDKLTIFMRSFLLQTGWNYLRYQGLGFAFVMSKYLKAVYPDEQEYKKILPRYMAVFNTNPIMASFAYGALGNMEKEIVKETSGDRGEWGVVKSFLMSTLASIGDRYFWATLRPFAFTAAMLWLLVCCPSLLSINEAVRMPSRVYIIAALLYLLAYNIPAFITRWKGIGLGAKGTADDCYGLLAADWNKIIKVTQIIGFILVLFAFSIGVFGVFYNTAFSAEFVMLGSIVAFFIILSLAVERFNIPNVYIYLAATGIFYTVMMIF